MGNAGRNELERSPTAYCVKTSEMEALSGETLKTPPKATHWDEDEGRPTNMCAGEN